MWFLEVTMDFDSHESNETILIFLTLSYKHPLANSEVTSIVDLGIISSTTQLFAGLELGTWSTRFEMLW